MKLSHIVSVLLLGTYTVACFGTTTKHTISRRSQRPKMLQSYHITALRNMGPRYDSCPLIQRGCLTRFTVAPQQTKMEIAQEHAHKYGVRDKKLIKIIKKAGKSYGYDRVAQVCQYAQKYAIDAHGIRAILNSHGKARYDGVLYSYVMDLWVKAAQAEVYRHEDALELLNIYGLGDDNALMTRALCSRNPTSNGADNALSADDQELYKLLNNTMHQRALQSKRFKELIRLSGKKTWVILNQLKTKLSWRDSHRSFDQGCTLSLEQRIDFYIKMIVKL